MLLPVTVKKSKSIYINIRILVLTGILSLEAPQGTPQHALPRASRMARVPPRHPAEFAELLLRPSRHAQQPTAATVPWAQQFENHHSYGGRNSRWSSTWAKCMARILRKKKIKATRLREINTTSARKHQKFCQQICWAFRK